MVAMVLLTFIVLGLLAMFQQVQKAFRSSITQVDILEAGRANSDMIGRTMEQMRASSFGSTNPLVYQSTNFFAFISPDYAGSFHQPLPGNGSERTNVIQTIFFLSKSNQDWIATGYQVRPYDDYANSGIGALFQFQTNVSQGSAKAFPLSQLFLNSLPARGSNPTNLNRIADGVVSFRVRAYDTNGVEITTTNTNPGHLAFVAPVGQNNQPRLITITNGFGSWDNFNGQYNYYFVSNAVPASVELEIAFLEGHLVDRYRALSGGLNPVPTTLQDSQKAYLSNHVANVHVFRQRIPVRNVDPSAYQ